MTKTKYYAKMAGVPGLSPSGLQQSADVDFSAAIVLWDLGLVGNAGSFWLLPHAIEKYMKCILLPQRSKLEIRAFNHRIGEMWPIVRETAHFDEELQLVQFDDFVLELASFDTATRYSEHGSEFSVNLIFAFALLGTSLRYELRPKLFDSLGNYGLGPIGPEGISSKLGPKDYRAAKIVGGLLHKVIEHQKAPRTPPFGDVNMEENGMAPTSIIKSGAVDGDCPYCG